MKFAIFRCCATSAHLKQHDSSADAVMRALGVEIIEIKEFNCCGYPLKGFNPKAYALASARNLALSAAKKLDIVTVCSCCFGSLKKIKHLMETNAEAAEEINGILKKEGLFYNGGVEIKHFLQILHDDIGPEEIKKKIKNRLDGLRVAVHYGCHLLRPANILEFDKAFAPKKFDNLVEVTGAESVEWPAKLECCGSPLLGINDDLMKILTGRKLEGARRGKADCLCVVCPCCQLQFDNIQKMMFNEEEGKFVPSLLFAQLLGFSLGIDGKILGLSGNKLLS